LCRPEKSDFFNMGTNWPSVWVKMISSWACVAIYMLVLVCPRLLCSVVTEDGKLDDADGDVGCGNKRRVTKELGTLV
jgi:hypothetical protein